VNPVAAVSSVLRRYADFSGRARRGEYWWFVLLRAAALAGLAAGVGVTAAPEGTPDPPVTDVLVAALLVLLLGTALPDLAVASRRLHDVGLSGLWILVNVVPGIGPLTVFVMTVLPGDRGPNRFGPDPRAHRSGTVAARHAAPAVR